MKIVIATGNNHKKEEIEAFLGDKFTITTMSDEGIFVNIVEDGNSFEENAMIKARALKEYTKDIIVADDSGLSVDVLEGRPGVYSARYAGEEANDDKNNEKLLEDLREYSKEERKATFICVVAVIFPDGQEQIVRGECRGSIGFEGMGENGFGYDPLFIVEGTDKTYAQMSSKEKNIISHRAKALKKLREILEK